MQVAYDYDTLITQGGVDFVENGLFLNTKTQKNYMTDQ